MNKEKAIIIFTKFPEYGKVKTRLAATIGNDKAIKFYKICAENLFDTAAELENSVRVFLFYNSKKNEQKIRKWINRDFIYFPQTGNDLGEKMLNAFTKVSEEGYEKIVIVGTDIPDISAALLRNAFDELDTSDVVVGPSQDGGYYLLGMKDVYRRLFDKIEWSTSEVFDKTIKKIKKMNLKYSVLPVLQDIDTEMELLKWLNSGDGNGEFKEKLRKKVFED